MKATFVLILLFMAWATVTSNDRRIEAQSEQPAPAVRVLTIPHDPLNPPRCPKVNARGVPLLNEVAMKADGGDWVHGCEYGVRA